MTTRRRLSWLIGLVPFAAKGQRMCTDDSRTALIKIPGMHFCDDQRKPPAWQAGKALNNQCPVCGTMAPPYKRETRREYDWRVTKSLGPDVYMAPIFPPMTEAQLNAPYGVRQLDIQCVHCKVKFVQDAVN